MSKENIEKFISENFKEKPTLTDLSNKLNITPYAVLKRLHKFEATDLVDENSLLNRGKNNHQKSAYEDEIAKYIRSLGISVETNNRKIINPQELDIYIPSKNIAIEFNGDYWHSDIFTDKYKHRDKSLKCKALGIHLIHIFEFEWIKEDTKAKIKTYLNEVLRDTEINRSNVVLYAENLDNTESSIFIEKYDIENYKTSDINIGLMNNNSIVGVVGFESISENTYNINNIHFRPGYNTEYGYKTVFDFFKTHYTPNKIYANIDFTKKNCGILEKVGFKYVDLSEPDYVWVGIKSSRGSVINKTDTMNIISNEELQYMDESEAMFNHNYLRIYNSGNLRYEWNNPAQNTEQ